MCCHPQSACINAGSLALSSPFMTSGLTFIINDTITTPLPSCYPASISDNSFHLRWRSSLTTEFQIKGQCLVAPCNLHHLDHKRPAQFVRALEDTTAEEKELSLNHCNSCHDHHCTSLTALPQASLLRLTLQILQLSIFPWYIDYRIFS